MSVIGSNILAGASGQQGYNISRSVRLRSSASAYFNRTFSTPTDAKKWTFNRWVKRGSLGARQSLFSAGSSGTSYAHIEFKSDDTIQILSENSATQFQLVTTQVFRDPSAWYNLHIIYDCANATSSDRLQLWINGVRVTAFSTATYPSTTPNNLFNTAIAHQIGVFGNGFIAYFDGYQTELNFIDGQALIPSSFGEINTITGVWQPKKYTGTYGTNGFYLNFSDNSAATAAAIGKDYSGNGNNWTPNNINVSAYTGTPPNNTSYDSMLDVPTQWADGGNGRGNYAVLNPLDKTSTITAADGNLGLTLPANVAGGCGSTIAVSSGQWYAEVTPTSGSNALIGIVLDNLSQNAANSLFSTGYGYYQFNGNKYVNGAASAYGASYAANNVIGIALDFTSLTLTFYKNNVSQGAISIAAGSYKLTISNGSSTVAQVSAWNFGQRPFSYTPPSGFKALNTLNLPTPTILKGNQYFDATLYTGNGTSQNVVNSGGFQPDFVWYKDRSVARDHGLFDSIRGALNLMSSNNTAAESSVAGSLTAFNSNGYSIGSAANANGNGETYVGWQWLAGAGTTSNITVGQYSTSPNVPSIASTVSVNATAGFSIVTWAGSGAAGTIGHGLNAVPAMLITKKRTSATDSNWVVWQKNLTGGNTVTDAYYMYLNGTNGQNASGGVFYKGTDITSTTFGFQSGNANVNASGQNYVAYCFAEVAGYSAFGSYTGNGSNDGPFVFCGFAPKFVLLKIASGGTGSWLIVDSVRQTYNVLGPYLLADSSGVEGTTNILDFTSNGFKIRGNGGSYNTSSATHIFAAFAQNPFKNALAR